MDNCPTCGAYLLQGNNFCMICSAESEAPTNRALDADAPVESTAPNSLAEEVAIPVKERSDEIPVRTVLAIVGAIFACVAAVVVSSILGLGEEREAAAPDVAPVVSTTAAAPEYPTIVAAQLATVCRGDDDRIEWAAVYDPFSSDAHPIRVADLRSKTSRDNTQSFDALGQRWPTEPVELVLCVRSRGNRVRQDSVCTGTSAPREVRLWARDVRLDLIAVNSGESLWSNSYPAPAVLECVEIDATHESYEVPVGVDVDDVVNQIAPFVGSDS